MEVHGRQPQGPDGGRERLRRQEERRTDGVRKPAHELPDGLGAERVSSGAADRVGHDPEKPVLRSERRAGDAPRDVVEVSNALSEPDADPERRERVARLRQAFEAGELLTTDRIDRAATRLAGGTG